MKHGTSKAYNIAVIDENTAEINMYGEVVSKHPTDWWTGEKISGNFIALDEFLADLEEIKDKDNITIHINSVGGDFYAGLAIYNRLKALKGTVTTINDGLAASAASIIFMGGSVRKMNAGSNLMMHGVSGLLIGYYNAEDLKDIIKQFKAHNEAGLNVYAEASGKTVDECRSLMTGETWLTGQAAVDAGFADEVIGVEPVNMSLTNDKHFIISNGIMLPTNRMHSIPQGIPVMNSGISSVSVPENEPTDFTNTNSNTGGKNMEIKTIEDLKNAFPELTAQVEKTAMEAGRNEGVKAERARIQSIEEIENAIPDKDFVKNAKYGDTPLTAAEMALEAMKLESKIRANVLENMDRDAEATAGVASTPNSGNEAPENAAADDAAMIAESVKVATAMIGGK